MKYYISILEGHKQYTCHDHNSRSILERSRCTMDKKFKTRIVLRTGEEEGILINVYQQPLFGAM